LRRVPKQWLEQQTIPLPEPDEQRRIVAEIEKQFTRLEAGVAALRRVQANLKRYRAAVLKAACEGRLVPPEKPWNTTDLGKVLTRIKAGKSFRCEERPPNSNEIGVVKVSAVTWGAYDESESKTCLDASRVETQFLVQPEDFLFSRANTIELVGACVIAKKVNLRVMLSDKILRFSFSAEVLPTWVLYWLRSQFGRREIERLATGNQMSMRNIGQDRIRQIRITLPPLAEQKRIVAEVERRLSVVEELEAVVSANLQRATRLRQSILQKAFTGELT
jgi:type I restriction enzyme S subunit